MGLEELSVDMVDELLMVTEEVATDTLFSEDCIVTLIGVVVIEEEELVVVAIVELESTLLEDIFCCIEERFAVSLS
ncbi:MAG: hypothetical protein OCD76_08935 [Reichenbachiella sp.]